MAIATSQRAVDGGKIGGPAAVPSCLEIAMRFTLPNTKTAHCIIHGRYATAPGNIQTVADALFIALKGAWTADLGTLMHTATLFSGLTVRDMTAFTNPVFEAAGGAVPGTAAGGALPADVAGVLTEQVNVRGRGAKGRIYLPGWSVDADGGAGSMTIAAQTGLTAFGTGIFNALNAQTLTPCVAKVARQPYIGLTGTSHPARSAAVATVTSYVCKDVEWDTQRRRGH